MWLYIVSIMFILGGLPNITNKNNIAAGLACVLIGIAIIVMKAWISKEPEEETPEVEVEYRKKNNIVKKDYIAKRNAYDALMLRWKPIVDEHYSLSQEIDRLYAEANKTGDAYSPLMQQVIELCQRDICLEEQFRQYELDKIQADLNMGYTNPETMPKSLASYAAFKRLAIIYEKQKRYEDAIAVCESAIEAGRLDDGTQGKMPGRLAKLKSKLNKERMYNATQIDFGNPFE